MPIHEYTCRACDTRFDHLHRRLNDEAKVACPNCGSRRTDRALSLFSVGASREPSGCCQEPGMGCPCACEME